MFEAQPTLLSVAFIREGDYHARLRIRGNNDTGLQLSILHQSVEVSFQDIDGAATSSTIMVQDKEALVVLARRDSLIVGSGIFEVDTSVCDSIGTLLVPRCSSNLIVDQNEIDSFADTPATTLTRSEQIGAALEAWKEFIQTEATAGGVK